MRMTSTAAMAAGAAALSTLNFSRFDGMTPEMKALSEEIKGFGTDVKSLSDSMNKDLKALQSKLDTELKGLVDPLVKTQVEAMAASVATKHDALEKTLKASQEQIDKLETAFKRAPTPAGSDEEKKFAERAVKFFEQKANALGQLNINTPVLFENVDKDGYALWEKQYGLYLRRDDKFAGIDAKALSVGSNPDGGYLVPAQRSARIVTKIFESSPMRALATIETIGTNELEIPTDTDEASVGWVGETQTRNTTNTPQVGIMKIPVFELYAKPRATQKLLEDASMNIEAWLDGKLGDKFGRTEATAFVSGTGVNQPRGFLSYTFVTTAAAVTRGSPLSIVSGNATAITADAIVSLPFSIKTAYLNGASWLMKRSSVMAAMLLKDGQGQYMWRPGLSAGAQSILGGYNVNMADDMPAIGAGANAIAFGNWARAYTIVDRLGITTLRDPYSAKPFVEFYSRKRVGGDVTDFDAYVAMTIST